MQFHVSMINTGWLAPRWQAVLGTGLDSLSLDCSASSLSISAELHLLLLHTGQLPPKSACIFRIELRLTQIKVHGV